jgi:lysozyme
VEQEVKLSARGADLMHRYEGYRTRPYLCPAHIWTIGYGHVLYQDQIRLPVTRVGDYQGMIRKEYPLRPEDNRVWTKDEIENLFSQDVASFERGALRLSPNLAGRQGAFDAVVSFAFNAGLGNYQRSQIRIRNNRGEFDGAAEAFMMWTRGGGRELPGLVRRRKDERALFLSDAPVAG